MATAPLVVVLGLALGGIPTEATELSFYNTFYATCGDSGTCSGPHDEYAVHVLVPESGPEIPLAPGSRLAVLGPVEVIYRHSYDYPDGGGSYGDSLYRASFAIYAGIYGLSPDTVQISGTGQGRDSFISTSTYDERNTDFSGHIEYVHPALLANLGLRPDFQRGHVDFQISSYLYGTYANVNLTSIPEPGTTYVVGLGFVLLAARRRLSF